LFKLFLIICKSKTYNLKIIKGEIIMTNNFSNNNFNNLSYSFENSKLCVLNEETTAGPFYIDDVPFRISIAEEEIGVPLYLGFKIVNAKNCTKLVGAVVDIWQANALGIYSGYDTPFEELDLTQEIPPENSKRWLRGKQKTDELGFAEFKTIYPGKYYLRTNHIHLKVHYDNKERLITQLFFPQEINNYINNIYPYNMNQKVDAINNSNDIIILDYQGVLGGWPKITPFGDKFIATLTIGIDVN
jgi:protocatechuate 3,4-dioxygenase beta subunit